jgi:hypothetical protein
MHSSRLQRVSAHSLQVSTVKQQQQLQIFRFDLRQGWARAALKRWVFECAAAQCFLVVPLRAAALRCSTGFEGPALQRGAAAARKEAQMGPFLRQFLKKKVDFSAFLN